jgi:hypothetical protein
MSARLGVTPHPPSLFSARPTPVSMRRLDYRNTAAPAQVVDRVRGEFVEMRGFSPTMEQAARLFHLTPEECQSILGNLVQEGFLRRMPDGRYRLPTS